MPVKTLVVYYSRSGTTRKLAKGIAESLGADIEEIVELRDRRGGRGYVRSLVEALRRRPTPISPAKQDPAAYGLVVVGTPVWVASLSSPVRSYLLANKARLREVAFFCTLGGSGNERAFAQMQELTERPPRSLCAVTAADLAAGRHTARVAAFVNALAAPPVAAAA
jgi:flavodoxin